MKFQTGIYFLIKGSDIIYIGKTTRYPLRLKYHNQQKMDYDTVKFIECEKSKLGLYERRWIVKFEPKHNGTFLQKIDAKKIKIHPRTIKIRMKFRKLTEKSMIGFGSYRDWTVEALLKHGKHVDLCQMYFNMSHITFFDNILDLLKITEAWRIQKPGSDRDKGRDFTHFNYPDEMELRTANAKRHEYKKSKEYLKSAGMHNRDKGYHQAFNHGKR